MGNLVRKTYYDDASWTAPAGVTQVTVTSLPTFINTLSANFDTTAASAEAVVFIDNFCDAYAWGTNTCGRLGNGSITVACLPTLVCCGLKWRQIGGGGTQGAVGGVTTSGDGYAWGNNNCGALGNGSITVACLPTLICCGLKWKQLTGIIGFTNHMMGIAINGDGYAWGDPTCGALGNGAITVACLPTPICCGFKWRQLGGGANTGPFSMGLTTTCDLYGWGTNTCGTLGNGSISVKCLPTLVCCGIKWRSFAANNAHVLAIDVNCNGYAWGSGLCGALGNNTVNGGVCLPTPICCGFKWRQFSVGACHSLGITYDGDMYAWGTNTCGRLGIGSITATCQPTLVCCGIKWRYVMAHGTSSFGISIDGDAYGWGTNVCGVLGNGSITVACLPTKVCCGKTWLPLVARQRKTFNVTPNTAYCIKVLAKFPSFNGEAVTDDVANEALILEWLA